MESSPILPRLPGVDKPIPKPALEVLSSSHRLSAEELATGRALGTLKMRQRYLLEALTKLLDRIDKLDQDYLILLSPQSSEGSDSCALRAQELLARRYIGSSLSSSLLKNQEKRVRSTLGGSSLRARARRVDYSRRPDFCRFWDLYPKKVGKDEAFEAWLTIAPDAALVDEICRSLEGHLKADWAGKDRTYLKDPVRWLKGAKWKDEVIASAEDEAWKAAELRAEERERHAKLQSRPPSSQMGR